MWEVVWGKWRGDSETCVCGGGEFEEGFYDLPANGNKKQGRLGYH